MRFGRRRQTKYQKTGQTLYRILPVDTLSKEQKEVIDAQIRNIPTGDEAVALAGKGDWGYRRSMFPGSLGFLTFRGIEVALFYKRQIISIQSEECDPVPPHAIKDPKDAWVRVEFLHSRASVQRSTWYAERETKQNQRIAELEGLVGTQGLQINAMEMQVVGLEQNKEQEKQKNERYKKVTKRMSQKNAILQTDLDEAFKDIGVLENRIRKLQARLAKKSTKTKKTAKHR